MDLVIEHAQRADIPVILQLIQGLAAYEKLEGQVTARENDLERTLFDQNCAHVLIARENGKAVGFALYFYNYSTFLGRPGLYLEDLFVRPECRGRGYGLALMKTLAGVALEKGCGRFEWSCLDDNEPALAFYRSLGARPMSEWTAQRLDEDQIRLLAQR